MAIGRQWREAVRDELGIADGLLVQLERRLGERGLLPRGPRGVHAPHFEALHGARFIVGAVALLTDRHIPASDAADAVIKCGNLRHSGEVRAITNVNRESYFDLRDAGSDYSYPVLPTGIFEHDLAHVLENIGHPERGPFFRREVQEVALRWDRDAIFGVVTLAGGYVLTGVTGAGGRDLPASERYPVYYGAETNLADAFARTTMSPGLVREARIEQRHLIKFGTLLHSREGRRRHATPPRRAETTTREDDGWPTSSSAPLRAA